MLNFVQFYVLVQDASCGEKNDPMGLFIRSVIIIAWRLKDIPLEIIDG